MRFIDHAMDKVVLLCNRETKAIEGKILAYYSKSGMCYVCIELYIGNSFNGIFTEGYGKNGGYGLDNFSAAVVSACKNAITTEYTDKYTEIKSPIKTGSCEEIKDFVFCHGDAQEKSAKYCTENKIIPVYSGAGNTESAFSLYFDYVQAL